MHRKGSEQTCEVPSEGRRALKHAGFMLIFACLANELKVLRKKSNEQFFRHAAKTKRSSVMMFSLTVCSLLRVQFVGAHPIQMNSSP